MPMKLSLGLAAGLVVLTVLTYGTILGHDFLSWDDDVFVYRNPHLQPPTLASLRAYWTAPYAHLYVPIPYTAWWALARVCGHSSPQGHWTVPPLPFHAASLLVHLVNVLLAFGLLRLLTRHDGAAFAGALLYAVHPIQVESVAWLSELKDLLSGTFSLTALWLFLGWLRREERTPWRWALATVAFGLALLCKPNVVALPLIAALLGTVLEGQSYRRWGGVVLLWLGLAGAYTLFTRHAQPIAPELALPLGQRVFVAGDTLAFYLGKLVWPARLAADYGHAPAVVLKTTVGHLTWLVPVALVVAAYALRRRWPWCLGGLGTFLLALVPSSGLAPFDFQQYSTPADHYAYVALLGPALLVAAFLAVPRRFLTYGLCGIGLALLMGQSYLQTMTWQNNLTFWNHTLEVNPQSFLAHNNLGAFYQTLNKPEQAIAHYKQGLALRRDDPDTLINLGMVLYSVGQGEQALPYLQRGLAQRPGDPKALLLSGRVLLEENHPAEALPLFETLVSAQPGDVLGRHGLAQALAAVGRREEAIGELHALLRDVPDYTPAAEDLKKLTER